MSFSLHFPDPRPPALQDIAHPDTGNQHHDPNLISSSPPKLVPVRPAPPPPYSHFAAPVPDPDPPAGLDYLSPDSECNCIPPSGPSPPLPPRRSRGHSAANSFDLTGKPKLHPVRPAPPLPYAAAVAQPEEADNIQPSDPPQYDIDPGYEPEEQAEGKLKPRRPAPPPPYAAIAGAESEGKDTQFTPTIAQLPDNKQMDCDLDGSTSTSTAEGTVAYVPADTDPSIPIPVYYVAQQVSPLESMEAEPGAAVGEGEPD